MKIKDLRAELESRGVGTATFLEKSEFVAALKQARAMGTTASAPAPTPTPDAETEAYRDVTVERMSDEAPNPAPSDPFANAPPPPQNPFGGAPGGGGFDLSSIMGMLGNMGGNMGGMDVQGMLQKALGNPKAMAAVQKAAQNPRVMAAVQDCMSNGVQNMVKYKDHCRVGGQCRQVAEWALSCATDPPGP